MPTTNEQDEASGALFNFKEVGRLMTILQDQTFAETKALADGILVLKTSDGETLQESDQALLMQTRADLAYFFDGLPDGTIRSGQDFDISRDKEEVRQRVRLRCGLPAVSTIIASQLAAASSLTRRGRVSQTIPTRTTFNG